jgi:hypothetical protein
MDEAAYQFGQYNLAVYPTSSSGLSAASQAVAYTVCARDGISGMSTNI